MMEAVWEMKYFTGSLSTDPRAMTPKQLVMHYNAFSKVHKDRLRFDAGIHGIKLKS